MKDYKAKRTLGNGEKHIVYYLHTRQTVPLSLGWDYDEISKIVEEDRHLSVYVGFLAKRVRRQHLKQNGWNVE